MYRIILLIFLFCFFGCAVYTTEYYEAYLNKLLGISETELISLNGIPTKTYKTDEAKFLVYYKEFSNYNISNSHSNTDLYKNILTDNYFVGTDTTSITTNYKEYCQTTFILINNKVVKYSFQGNKCGEYIYKGETITNF